MKLSPNLKKEILRIAIGVILCCIAANAIYLGIVFGFHLKYDRTITFGSILGSAYAIFNFYLQAKSVQKAIDAGDQGAILLRKSYSLRMLGIIALLVISFVLKKYVNILAVAVCLLFPRITIFFMQLFGMYKPEQLDHADKSEEEKEVPEDNG